MTITMKRNPTLYVLPLAAALAACTPAPPPAAEGANSPAVTPTAAPALTGFAIGNYVDSNTFAVGGQGSEFKSGDYLYATTSLSNATPGLKVTVKVSDESGKVIIEKTGSIENANQAALNIDLGVPKEVILPAGKYKFQAIMDGKEASSHSITII